MQFDEPQTLLATPPLGSAASATPLLYPFTPRRSRHAYTSIATLKAAARASLSASSHSSATAQLSHLWPLAEELLLQAASLQNVREASIPEACHPHALRSSPDHDSVPVAASSPRHAEGACMRLRTQLPDQSELMGVPVGETVMELDACTDDDADACDVNAVGPPVATHAFRSEELPHSALDSSHTDAEGVRLLNACEGSERVEGTLCHTSGGLYGGLKGHVRKEETQEVVGESHTLIAERGMHSLTCDRPLLSSRKGTQA